MVKTSSLLSKLSLYVHTYCFLGMFLNQLEPVSLINFQSSPLEASKGENHCYSPPLLPLAHNAELHTLFRLFPQNICLNSALAVWYVQCQKLYEMFDMQAVSTDWVDIKLLTGDYTRSRTLSWTRPQGRILNHRWPPYTVHDEIN